MDYGLMWCDGHVLGSFWHVCTCPAGRAVLAGARCPAQLTCFCRVAQLFHVRCGRRRQPWQRRERGWKCAAVCPRGQGCLARGSADWRRRCWSVRRADQATSALRADQATSDRPCCLKKSANQALAGDASENLARALGIAGGVFDTARWPAVFSGLKSFFSSGNMCVMRRRIHTYRAVGLKSFFSSGNMCT
jgi:hypothetical protein